jgi:hypothetical protein
LAARIVFADWISTQIGWIRINWKNSDDQLDNKGFLKYSRVVAKREIAEDIKLTWQLFSVLESTSEFVRGTACYNDSVYNVQTISRTHFQFSFNLLQHSLGSGKECFLMALDLDYGYQ